MTATAMTIEFYAMLPKLQSRFLKFWHAWLAGSFLVAYLTADEDTYAMHLFAGYAVVAALAIRLVVGIFVRENGPMGLPRPSIRAFATWFKNGKGRHPLFAWLASGLLVGVGLAAGSGVLSDSWISMEGPHEILSNLSLGIILSHFAFVTYIYGGRQLWVGFAERFSSFKSLIRGNT